ncbi:mannonate dehydratase [Klebsiella pneumoniae]|uniref:Mannonate dehydratase n=1 Tax=Klebsiella pneumoniae TaxID=573 RepID=A0A377TWH8_KLEPN|nr:mannonate dehydratase [Klebsiella pneumoniae]
MEQTWRWYGPNDPVSLDDVRQAGATGVVTALHHIANGQVWPVDEIKARQALLAAKGLTWSVVESIPVHEDIKTHSGQYATWIANYQQSIRNLAACGIDTVCYNFMPILDWTRTDLEYELPDGSRALRFDQIAFAAFELHILKRPGAEADYSEEEQRQAEVYFKAMSEADIDKLTRNIIAGLPGAEEGYTLDQFRARLAEYDHIDKAQLRENMAYFLRAIVPVCEEVGIRLAVHPDDPPRPILGLPRIVSTIEDMQWLKETVDSINNGFTMCTGSYGVRADNDLVKMVETFGDRIHFTHLRSTCREANPKTSTRRRTLAATSIWWRWWMLSCVKSSGVNRPAICARFPFRPDHGHQMLDDLRKKTNPGYSAIGRLKGMAEVRGVELALKMTKYPELL